MKSKIGAVATGVATRVTSPLHGQGLQRAADVRTLDASKSWRQECHDWGMYTWQDAEDLAAEHLRKAGFHDARRMPDGPDGGVDVAGTGVIAQVKWWSNPVGISEVQRLRGTAHDSHVAAFYSRAGYTRSAATWAEAASVALFVFDEAGFISPANETATRIAPLPSLQEGEDWGRCRAAWNELDLALKRHRRARDTLLRAELERLEATGTDPMPEMFSAMIENGTALEAGMQQAFEWHSERNLVWREETVRAVLRTVSEMESVWEQYWQRPRAELLPPLERFQQDQFTGIWVDLWEQDSPHPS